IGIAVTVTADPGADADEGLKVTEPDRMTRVRIASDIPEAERPVAQVLDTASPRFRALVAETRTARGADFSVCDIVLPSQVTGQASTGPAA
ncbi:MAG: peptidyl-prolyl cis-trans isomerase cyclophilin type, partial [Brevundimonas sp.]|nr:peptidyl-prolyl cis-trans isomerase cyclophilin type [Brevundimonas sp.]